MIKNLCLKNFTPYYDSSVILKKLNFFFGANGSGKSRLTQFLSDPTISTDSKINWDNTVSSSLFIFNKAYVEREFKGDIKGIFTLGEDTIGKKTKIDVLNVQISTLKDDIDALNTEIAQNAKGIDLKKDEFIDIVWDTQKEYGKRFSMALQSARGTKKDFFDYLNNFYKDPKNSPKDYPFDELIAIYEITFSKNLIHIPPKILFDVATISNIESSDLLSKIIVGSGDSPLRQFYEFLHNSDWVKTGSIYLPRANGKCPYCNQFLPKEFGKNLENFFDISYERDCSHLDDFNKNYKSATSELINSIQNTIDNPFLAFDYTNLSQLLEHIKQKIENNLLKLSNKILSPSIKINLDYLSDDFQIINSEYKKLNFLINKNNSILSNQKMEQSNFKITLQEFLCYKLKTILEEYNKFESASNAYKSELDKRLNEKKSTLNKLEKELSDISNTLTSVRPTAININKLLGSFGFNNFSVIENPDDSSTYKILRPSGHDAKDTLSEGEYNFITFLYFYYSLFGNSNPDIRIDDKIIVIDDPISSLDSKVSFIVSSLIKSIIASLIQNKEGFKQIIILSHNIFFFKEITRRGSNDYSKTFASYFILKKTLTSSEIIQFDSNPIKSSYELLWNEYREGTDKLSVFNIQRRILEHYFTVIGPFDKLYDCIESITGKDGIIAEALLMSLNNGSHCITDDLYIDPTESCEDLKRVFELIFEVTKQHDHYNMMMRIES